MSDEQSHTETQGDTETATQRQAASRKSFLRKITALVLTFCAGFYASYLTRNADIAAPVRSAIDGKRFFFLKPAAPYKVSDLVVPARYTIIVLSAKWCAPCEVLRRELRDVARFNNQIVVVDVDVSEAENTSHPILSPFRLSSGIALPVAFVFDPYWVFTKSGDKLSVPPPVEGLESIHSKLGFLLAKDGTKDLASPVNVAINKLEELERGSDHYAK